MRPWPPHEVALAIAWREVGLTHREVGAALDRTEEAVRDKIGRNGAKRVKARVRNILADVSKETGIPADEIIGRSLRRPVSFARWSAWKRMYDAGMSLSDIGRETGFDHTSVMYGLDQLGRVKRPPPPRAETHPPRPLKVRGRADEERRMETIRQYWADRGVEVDLRCKAETVERIGGIACTRSRGIPVRGKF